MVQKYIIWNAKYARIARDVLTGDNALHVTCVLSVVRIEKLPECHVNTEVFIGQNDCNIPLDDIQLSCSVRYFGTDPPELEWRESGENETLPSNCVTEYGYQTCSVTLKPDIDFHGSSFICQTKRSAAEEQYNCTTK